MEIKTANTILYCNRWQETVDFYEKAMALPVTLRKAWFVEFWLNEHACLSVADAAHASIGSSAGRGLTISLRVAHIDELHSALEAAGLQPSALREQWSAVVFTIHDPEGNRIEFWARPRDRD